jgi:hypothetical protein
MVMSITYNHSIDRIIAAAVRAAIPDSSRLITRRIHNRLDAVKLGRLSGQSPDHIATNLVPIKLLCNAQCDCKKNLLASRCATK